MTSNLVKRMYEHKNDIHAGFTNKYKTHILVYYEVYNKPDEAIMREKRLKEWKRKWKLELIEEKNPYWKELYAEIL